MKNPPPPPPKFPKDRNLKEKETEKIPKNTIISNLLAYFIIGLSSYLLSIYFAWYWFGWKLPLIMIFFLIGIGCLIKMREDE